MTNLIPVATPPPDEATVQRRRQIIGVSVLAACLLLGGGVIWWFFYGSTPTRQKVKVDPKEQAALPLVFPGGPGRAREGRMISRVDNASWLVRGDVGEMKAALKGSAYQVSDFRYVAGMKLPDEQWQMLLARRRIVQDPAMAKAWGITPDQKAKLEKLKPAGSGVGGFMPSAEDQAALAKLFGDYRGTADGPTRSELTKKILDRLDALAKSTYEPTRQDYSSRAQQVREILTEQQRKKILGLKK